MKENLNSSDRLIEDAARQARNAEDSAKRMAMAQEARDRFSPRLKEMLARFK